MHDMAQDSTARRCTDLHCTAQLWIITQHSFLALYPGPTTGLKEVANYTLNVRMVTTDPRVTHLPLTGPKVATAAVRASTGLKGSAMHATGSWLGRYGAWDEGQLLHWAEGGHSCGEGQHRMGGVGNAPYMVMEMISVAGHSQRRSQDTVEDAFTALQMCRFGMETAGFGYRYGAQNDCIHLHWS